VLAEAVRAVAGGDLPSPRADFQLLWATGPAHVDDVRARVAPLALGWLHVVGYIEEMPEALAATDVAVSRAGAMATAELLAWGIPAILVPLPTAAADHQRLNAEALERAGAAVHMPQSGLEPGRLWRELLSLAGDDARRQTMSRNARRRGNPDAARRIAGKLIELLPEAA
ncbi:MAG: UDP-N-acetylglucosamine--N-acetylmuramyl-(pentapeptide) pyrophosphoryl-undecaprenol N-acetylglucosamine transferase, partial [Longimicrobiales bacterium]